MTYRLKCEFSQNREVDRAVPYFFLWPVILSLHCTLHTCVCQYTFIFDLPPAFVNDFFSSLLFRLALFVGHYVPFLRRLFCFIFKLPILGCLTLYYLQSSRLWPWSVTVFPYRVFVVWVPSRRARTHT